MASKFVDVTAIVQVIGCVFNSPTILDDTDKYIITEEDFTEDFHKIVFGSIYNIHATGSDVTIDTIIDYLGNRPKYDAIFKQNKGIEYLEQVSQLATFDTFQYYYNRLKKFTLMRAYDNFGLDMTQFYDPNNILDTKKKQLQEDWLDNTSLVDIAKIIDEKIDSIKAQYVEDDMGEGYQAGDGVLDLIEELEKHPEVGIPLYGPLINTVTRGARLRKFYLRSGATGTGKTRAMIADACTFACNEIYEPDFGMWIKNGKSQPTLFIATEQDKSEVQTMMLAFLSAVNEEHILNGRYEEGERERVVKAAEVLKRSSLWIEELPDFSLQDVENKIKKYIREYDVRYIVHDYIHTSMKILEEITKRSGGVRLREDNVLFMLSTRLKDLCNKYGIFIMSGTQLNGDYTASETPDQNLLRGAKSIADKIDCGLILLNTRDTDLVKLEPILESGRFKTPNIKLSVYKNRRGRYKGIYLWCDADLGTCRIKPMFATTYNYELVSIEDIKIMVDEEPAPWQR
jgi:replicative DNA helicase